MLAVLAARCSSLVSRCSIFQSSREASGERRVASDATHQLYAHCVCVHLRSCELRRINICGRKKLPFAEYSVVKDHSGGNIAPRNLAVAAGRFPPDPLGSLTRGAPKPRSVRSPELIGGHQSLPSRSAVTFIGAKAGGEYRARTGDLLVANQALSQLS
jgi:hypothetical protein